MNPNKIGLMVALGLMATTGLQPAGAQAAGGNLFQNPGFESNQDWWGFTDSLGTGTGTLTFNDPMAVHGGAKGAKVVVTAVSTENWHIQLQCPPQFEAIMNAQYQLSFWGRTNSPDGKSVHVAIQDGAPNYTYRSGQDSRLDTAWQKIERTWTSDVAGQEMLRFNLYLGSDTGTYYFDDFMLTASVPTGLRDKQGSNRVPLKLKNAAAISGVDAAGRSVKIGKSRGRTGKSFFP